MSQQTWNAVFLLVPLIIGALIAAFNASGVNDATEGAEARIRGWQLSTSSRNGFFFKYVLNPLLWAIVKFCDWTDGFAHRGLKNGARVASTLYLIGFWLVLIYVAVVVVIAIVVLVVVLAIVGKLLSSSSGSSETSFERSRPVRNTDDVRDHVGVRGKKVYGGTSWLNEELKGRVDDDGNIYKGTNWLSEEKIGRIDEDGNIYQGTSWMNETKVGRVDKDGTLYKGASWFSEEKTGRIDEDGTIHKGTSWFNEEKQGRTGD